MKSKKPNKNQPPNTQFKPLPPVPLKKLTGVKTYQNLSKDVASMQLEKVIGMSSRNINSIAINPMNGDLAYPAGCIVCIYSPKDNKQSKFLQSRSSRSFSCIAYSQNGRVFAAGEGAFRQPEITIWEISLDGAYTEVRHLKGHKYGIESVMFSPNLEYLISLGDNNDRGLFVWDWDKEQRVTSNKLGKPVNTFCFAENGEYFVTAGYQHLKFWFFDETGKVQKTETNSKESIMESKSADLTKVKLKVFVGVCCKQMQVFALAQDGHLYIYDRNRKLQKWMNIKVEKALSCTMTNDYLFCGCSDGIIRVFTPKSLEHIITLPKPPPLGTANIEAGVKTIRIPAKQDSKFSDTMAVIVDEKNQRVVALYSDRMVFMWDIKNLQKISVYRTFLYHCGPIHDIQSIPNNVKVGFKETVEGGTSLENETGITKFVTCSSDRTIRFWHFVDPSLPNARKEEVNSALQRNAYCKDMSRMIYVSSDITDGKSQYDNFKLKPSTINEDGTTNTEQGAGEEKASEIDQLLRCIKCSPDWKHIASGDWTGNIRIHDLSTFEELQCIQAHEHEVICLDYSPIIDQPSSTKEGGSYKYLLASGSRDRLTQIFDINDNIYENISILEDHSSTITALRFAEEKGKMGRKRLKIITCGADKSIVLRNLEVEKIANNDAKKLQPMNSDELMPLQHKEQCKNKIFTMDIAPTSQHVLTGHDKLLQLWNLGTLEKIWEKKPESERKSGSQDQIKVHIDPYSSIIIASSTDKQVTVYEAATGHVICRTTCGEIITAICLSSNLKHIITASADGIIYIWKLPDTLVKALQKVKLDQKQKEQSESQQKELEEDMSSNKDDFEDFNQLESQPKKEDEHTLEESIQEKKDIVQNQVADIMSQINKVTEKIEKIEEIKKLPQPEGEDQEAKLSSRGESEESKGRNPQGRKRKDWAKEAPVSEPTSEPKPKFNVKQGDESGRELNVNDRNLPRWAQSVAGDPKGLETTPNSVKKESTLEKIKDEIQELSSSETEDIEDIFQSTLAQQEKKLLHAHAVVEQPVKGIPAMNFYPEQKEEEEEDKKGIEDDQEDEEEKMIKARMKKNKLKQIYGFIEGDEENNEMMKRRNENRTSISQQFFKRKIGQSTEQSSIFKEAFKRHEQQQFKQQPLKLEDIQPSPRQDLPKKQMDEKEVKESYQAKIQEEQKKLEREHSLKKVQIEKDIHDKKIKLENDLAEQKRKIEEQKSAKIKKLEEQAQLKARKKIEILEDSDSLSDEEEEKDLKESVSIQDKMKNLQHKNEISPVPKHQTHNKNNQSMSRYERTQTEDELDESNYVQMESANKSSAVDEAAINAVIKAEMDKINDSLAKITQTLNSSKSAQGLKVKEEVGDSVNRSLNLYNSMMFSLNSKTSFHPQGASLNASASVLNQSQGSMYSQVSVKDDARDLLAKYSDILVEEIRKKLGQQ